jgi:hypothetical protein
MKYIITEPQYNRLVVGNTVPHPKYISQELNKLGKWLYKTNGLGLEKIIDDFLDEMKNPISDSDIEKYEKGAEILYNHNKINEREFDNFVKTLPNKKLVYDDEGNWHPVNKLNTNYTDLSVLLTDLLFLSYENGSIPAKKILEKFKETTDITKRKDILSRYKNRLPQLVEKYLESSEEILSYVGNSIKKSEQGSEVEDDVRDKLLSLNPGLEFPKLLYQGGNGDFIDMIFSVDLIVEFSEDVVKTIQIKSNEGQIMEFVNDKEKSKSVDLAIWPSKNENNEDIFKAYIINSGKIKTIK